MHARWVLGRNSRGSLGDGLLVLLVRLAIQLVLSVARVKILVHLEPVELDLIP